MVAACNPKSAIVNPQSDGLRPHLPLTWRDSGMSRVRGGTDLRTGRLDAVLTV